MSHDTNYYTYVYGYDSSNNLYYPAIDSDGNGRVELYGSGATHAFVVIPDRTYMSSVLWEYSPYGSGSSLYDDSQNFVSQNLVTHENAYGSELSVTLDKLYDTRGGSFGSGSSSSDLYTTSHVYANGVSALEMGSSDVLVYQFQTEGSYGGGQLTFTRSNETALWDTDPVQDTNNNQLNMYDFSFYGSSDAQTMFGRGSGYYYDVSLRDDSGGGSYGGGSYGGGSYGGGSYGGGSYGGGSYGGGSYGGGSYGGGSYGGGSYGGGSYGGGSYGGGSYGGGSYGGGSYGGGSYGGGSYGGGSYGGGSYGGGSYGGGSHGGGSYGGGSYGGGSYGGGSYGGGSYGGGSYGGGDDGTHTYDYYISASDWENNVYHDNNHNLFIASGSGSIPYRQDSVVYEGNGSVGLAPVGTLTEGQMVRDAVERSFAESGYGSGSGEGGGYGSGSSGNGSGPSMYSEAYVNLVSDPGFDGYQEGDVVIVRGSMYVDHDGDGRIDDVISIGENNNFYVGNSLAFVGFDNPMSYAQTTFRFMDDEGNLLYQTMPGAGSGYSNSYTVTADDVLNTEFISVSADVLYYDASTGFSDVLTPLGATR